MNNKNFIFRNSSVEYLFEKDLFSFSELDSVFFDDFYDTYIFFYLCPIDVDYNTKVRIVNDFQNRVSLIHERLALQKQFIIFTIEDLDYDSLTNSDFSLKQSITNFNNFIIDLQKHNSNVKVIDFKSFTNKYSSHDLLDWRYFYLSRSIINPALKNDFSIWINNRFREFKQSRKKCLVLDMDNTLWGGILGEDGINGIKIGDTYPGNAFKHFQIKIKELKEIGVILAACSKNNFSDVKKMWKENDRMILKEDDFSVLQINWKNKAENINNISKELNIGLDSFVFIDDNPVERELIKQLLPEVTCLDFPDKPYNLYNYISYIKENYFSSYSITDEDLNKTENYLANIQRNKVRDSIVNLDDYLKSLQIELEIDGLNNDNCQRLSQLCQKTNQFNLSTIRYEESDLFKIDNKSHKIYSLKVNDKFGELGITGLMIIKYLKNRECEIDTFLMSCRILGRKIENVFLKYILFNLKKEGYEKVYAKHLFTKKNSQIKDFLIDNLFNETYSTKEESKYEKNIMNEDFNFSKIELETYKITYNNE